MMMVPQRIDLSAKCIDNPLVTPYTANDHRLFEFKWRKLRD